MDLFTVFLVAFLVLYGVNHFVKDPTLATVAAVCAIIAGVIGVLRLVE